MLTSIKYFILVAAINTASSQGELEHNFKVTIDFDHTMTGIPLGLQTGEVIRDQLRDANGVRFIFDTHHGTNKSLGVLVRRGDELLDPEGNPVLERHVLAVAADPTDDNGDGLLDSPEAELTCLNNMGQPDYCSPINYRSPARDTFYVNDGGRLADETVERGLSDDLGNGLGVGCADFDRDGWTDVFVANDGTPDFLWMNDDGARFLNEAALAGCAVDLDGVPK